VATARRRKNRFVRWSWRALPIAAAIAAFAGLAGPVSSKTGPAEPAQADEFTSKVRPILEAHCRPCHFPDGKMYARLPFDRPETIRKLGSARLFTRLKDQKERSVVRAFLGEEEVK